MLRHGLILPLLFGLLFLSGCVGSFSGISTLLPFALFLLFFTTSACIYHPITGIRNQGQGGDSDNLGLLALLGLFLAVPAAVAADDDSDSDTDATGCTTTQDYTQSFDLSTVDLAAAGIGYRLTGPTGGYSFGQLVEGLGDFNGDGIGDFLVAAPFASGNRGHGYIIFGKSGATGGDLDMDTLAAGDGVRLLGETAGDRLGRRWDNISPAGDINGDGLADLMVGAPEANGGVDGGAYLIYGTNSPADLTLSSTAFGGGLGVEFTNTGGFRAGWSVAGPGDINGDGVDDLVIGGGRAFGATLGGLFVLYGKTGGWGGTSFDMTAPAAADGFYFRGEAGGDALGTASGRVGDINGDNLNDIIGGSSSAGPGNYGAAWVIYGVNGTRPNVNLAGGIMAGDGFRLHGLGPAPVVYVADPLGGSDGADFDGDGITDFAIPSAGYGAQGGRVIVFAGDVGALSLGNPGAGQGFFLTGSGGERAGTSFSMGGDVNGDGLSDLLAGAPYADPGGRANAGSVHLVFGRSGLPNTGAPFSNYTNGTDGILIQGNAAGGQAGYATEIADVNGDSCADLLLGAPKTGDGYAYVIYGGVAQ